MSDNPKSKLRQACYQVVHAEAATVGVPQKNVLLKIAQNSQENTIARISFLIKLQAEPATFIKKETLAQVFSRHCLSKYLLPNLRNYFEILPVVFPSQ